MGDTRTAFQGSIGVAYQTIIAIEGYPYLITDGPTAAAVTAWAGTEWSAALGGLQVMWDWEQRFRPWDPDIQVDGLSFGVMDEDRNDTFGIAVGGTNAGVETLLTADLPAYDAVGVLPVKSTAAFASSGSVWLGVEERSYTGKTATTLTGVTNGRHAPFKANTESANRFGRAQPFQDIGDGQGTVTHRKVTSLPRLWPGRGVAVWIHRRVGSTLDTKAQAQCVFQGRIRDTRDTESGLTIIDCDDYRSKIKETTLLNRQFTCRVKEGVFLKKGWKFEADDVKAGSIKTADPLRVVASGASGANQINEGFYTGDDLADVLAIWWAFEKANGRLNLEWSWSPRVATQDGLRSMFRWTNGSASNQNVAQFRAPVDVGVFMGFAGDGFVTYDEAVLWTGTSRSRVSPEVPYRIYITSQAGLVFQIKVDDIKGQFFDNQPFWPSAVSVGGDTDGMFGVLQINGGPMAVWKYVDANTLQFGHSNRFLDEVAGVAWDETDWSETQGFHALRADVDGELRLRQVAFISGKLSTVLTKLLASTGTAGYNHATYDVFPAQLGAAIPWELLGTTWTNSILNLAESHGSGHGSLLLVIEKPTLLSEVIACELVARMSTIVMKDGCFKIATWGTPIASQATHTLTVANKAAPADAHDDQVTIATDTRDALCNVIKLEYNRDLKGGYRDTVFIRHVASIAELGVERAVTISMRNTFAARSWTTESIDEIIEGLIGAVSMFAYPLRFLKRTVDMSLFEGLAPGDFGTISDDHARDPTTGARGVTSKPHLLVSHRVDYGGYEQDSDSVRNAVAEVEVMILPITSIAAYSPAMEVDETAPSGGYSANTITVKANEHTLAAVNFDSDSFHDSDAIEIIQVDPADAAAPLRWTVNIDSVTSKTEISLDAALTGWDSTKRYRVRSQTYSAAVSVQRANVYQADDADALIEDLANPYVYGQAQQAGDWSSEADTGAELVELYSEAAYGDGKPLDTGYERALARLANNLASYRTGVCLNTMSRTVKASGTSGFTRKVIEVIKVPIGPFNLGVAERYIRVRPCLRRASAGPHVKLWATLCRNRPQGDAFITTDDNQPQYELVGPKTGTGFWETASTTFGSLAYGFLDFSIGVLDPVTGTGYLVLEAEPNVEIRGLSMLQLLPITFP